MSEQPLCPAELNSVQTAANGRFKPKLRDAAVRPDVCYARSSVLCKVTRMPRNYRSRWPRTLRRSFPEADIDTLL
jgi:hypothetical protein